MQHSYNLSELGGEFQSSATCPQRYSRDKMIWYTVTAADVVLCGGVKGLHVHHPKRGLYAQTKKFCQYSHYLQ